ncbi:hypothetical protein VNO80_26287 [Phaseolus coccineus]|uniref:Uncharacterized protein n=1 Tax=Phaseolus coccineus TaxID=3886 RepID=A0AAN9LEH0_PHACN
MKINLWKVPFDVDFHPSDNLVVTALINSDLHLQLEVHVHTDSCRAARFIDCGRVLLTASSDCSILATDVEIGSTMTRIDNVHEAGVKRLINLTESTVVSPDDVGFIKDDQKFVCGSPRGVILYSWECFQCTSGVRFFLHTNDPIDAMLKLDEDTIITGSDNGIINLVGISPDFIYPIVEHSGYLVECLALSHDKKFFESIAYDKKLKLWNSDSMLPEPEYIELQQRCTPMRFE